MLEVTGIKALARYRILVTFNTDEKKLFDMSKMLHYPVYHKLKNEDVFKAMSIRRGVVTWDNGNIDIAPEYMYYHDEKEEKLVG